MTCRFMRVIVFFDLPMTSAADRRIYTKFKKTLVKNGFLMMQESVYCKLALNQNSANSIISLVKNNKPDSGVVQILTITEKQYSDMEMIIGETKNDIVENSKRIIVL